MTQSRPGTTSCYLIFVCYLHKGHEMIMGVISVCPKFHSEISE